jgi:uridine kinase
MQKKPIIIGISGASGSGKTLLSTTIIEELGSNKVIVIKEDCYYKDQMNLTLEERMKINYDHPDAFDHDLLRKHLEDLSHGKAIKVPIYDYTKHTRDNNAHININYHDIIVLEGIMIFVVPIIRNLLDIKIYVDTPADLCFVRRIQRDVLERGRTLESVITQYINTVRPMFNQFIEPAKKHADVIIPKGGKNRVAIDLIKAKIKDLLKKGVNA